MAVKHYYNSAGEWIAFRRDPNDRYLFDRSGNWIGWFPWNDNEAVDVNGDYLGTVVDENRFYQRIKTKPDRPHPGYVPPPSHVGYAGHPGYAAYCAPPLGYDDAIIKPKPARRTPRLQMSPPRPKPQPKPTPLQTWMNKLGLGWMADRISRKI